MICVCKFQRRDEDGAKQSKPSWWLFQNTGATSIAFFHIDRSAFSIFIEGFFSRRILWRISSKFSCSVLSLSLSRAGTRSWGNIARSDAELAEIVDGLNEQEANERHMRSLTVIPPILLEKEQRNINFVNTNGTLLGGGSFVYGKEGEEGGVSLWKWIRVGPFSNKVVCHVRGVMLGIVQTDVFVLITPLPFPYLDVHW